MSANSRLKATKIIGQTKAFYRQRISESGFYPSTFLQPVNSSKN